MTPADEARILRKVAAAIRSAGVPGYWSPGGPQDGDSTPDSFDYDKAADRLEHEAERLEEKVT